MLSGMVACAMAAIAAGGGGRDPLATFKSILCNKTPAEAVQHVQNIYPSYMLSAEQDSFTDGLLDCPHYTRPEDFEGMRKAGRLAAEVLENYRRTHRRVDTKLVFPSKDGKRPAARCPGTARPLSASRRP
ncbi:MAG: hypothetical protein B7Z23_06895 [Pseudomonadales bacterium 32-61-5]|nr:MAG: hypothetical protein B7Z23_06895 [Pseudomonadales bacterium 32-61-5]